MKKRTSKHGTSFNGKIKTEHTILENLFNVLKILSENTEIKSIIPGKIMRRGSSTVSPQFNLTIPTPTGWKAIGKTKGATQDFFIVTDNKDSVKTTIEKLKY